MKKRQVKPITETQKQTSEDTISSENKVYQFTQKDIEDVISNLSENYSHRGDYIKSNEDEVYTQIYLMLSESLEDFKNGSHLFPTELFKAYLAINKVI